MPTASIARAAVAVTLTSLSVPTAASSKSRTLPEPLVARMTHAVDALARQAIGAQLGPALGIAVVGNGRVLFERAYGHSDATAGRPADARTLWYVASTSKSYTGVATVLLVERERITLETPISTLLPNAVWPTATNPDSLTLADFLAHTHGLGNGPLVMQAAFAGAVPERDWPALLATSPVSPSRALRYNNVGYNVAAMVIDARHAAGWRDFMHTQLLAPAGLHDTHTRVSGLDRTRFALPHRQHANGTFETLDFPKADATMNSAGGHLATLYDLARWTLLNLDAGQLDGHQVLPASVVLGAQRPLRSHAADDPGRRFGLFDREAWGAGWNLGAYEGARMVSRFGSYLSLRSHLSFLPEHGIGVVATTNGDPGSEVTDILAALVYDIVAGRDDAESRAQARLEAHRQEVERTNAAPRTASPTAVAASANDLGTFHHAALGDLVLFSQQGALHLRWGVLSGALTRMANDLSALRFDMAGNGVVLHVARDPQGIAHAITLFGHTADRRR